MSMDSFTAQSLLSALSSGSTIDEVADMYKMFNKNEGGPTKDATEFFKKNNGKSVVIKGTDNITGVIVALNTASCGFYPGSRFPIVVKLDSTGAKYEYMLDQVLPVTK